MFGDNVAVKLKALHDNQRIVEDKLINDMLFEAESISLFRGWQLSSPTRPNTYNTQNDSSGSNYTQLQPQDSSNNIFSSSLLFSTFNDD